MQETRAQQRRKKSWLDGNIKSRKGCGQQAMFYFLTANKPEGERECQGKKELEKEGMN